MAPLKPVYGAVKALFEQALRSAFPSIQTEVLVVKGNPKFADYQCNNAMNIFKDHGKSLGYASAVAVAEAIKKALPKDDMIGEVTVAQFFVNLKLNQDWITRQVTQISSQTLTYEDLPRKRCVVDFSSPNIAKEMHVGHLRSTIIGESVCKILEFCGHEVHRLNHVGDWGTQFGMLIEYMKETYPDFETSLPDISDLQEFYKSSKKRFDEDDAFKERARLAVVDLQSGGKFAINAWQRICDVSRKAFQKIYDRLKVTVEERGESYYNSMIPVLVKELQDRELVVESDGAMCLFTPNVSKDGPPLMAVKSDGGYGYDSTDLAAVYHRLFIMRADWVVYITDLGQEQHFHMIFDAARQAGWHREGVTRLDHMGFGVVQGEDGKKFKTRSGETVKLQDLLDEAVERAEKEIQSRVEGQEKDGGEAFLKTAEEQKEAAERIGIAAVRYFDMNRNRISPYAFSYDKMLDPKGNTAVYLFYAYMRIRSVQRKAGVDEIGVPKGAVLKLTDPSERALAIMVLQFPDVIDAILGDLHLHRLPDYLWETCTLLTTFYSKCRVLDVPEQDSRLLLLEATRRVLYQSFAFLGFEPLERL